MNIPAHRNEYEELKIKLSKLTGLSQETLEEAFGSLKSLKHFEKLLYVFSDKKQLRDFFNKEIIPQNISPKFFNGFETIDDLRKFLNRTKYKTDLTPEQKKKLLEKARKKSLKALKRKISAANASTCETLKDFRDKFNDGADIFFNAIEDPRVLGSGIVATLVLLSALSWGTNELEIINEARKNSNASASYTEEILAKHNLKTPEGIRALINDLQLKETDYKRIFYLYTIGNINDESFLILLNELGFRDFDHFISKCTGAILGDPKNTNDVDFYESIKKLYEILQDITDKNPDFIKPTANSVAATINARLAAEQANNATEHSNKPRR